MKKIYTVKKKIRLGNTVYVIFVLSAIILSSFLLRPQASPAVGLRADALRSGDFSKFNTPSPHITWTKLQTKGEYISSPVITSNVIYVGGLRENSLRAIDVQTGTQVWSFQAEDDIPFSPVVTDRSVFVTSTDGRLYALHKKTGVKKWEFRLNNFYSIATSPVYWNDTVYFGGRDTYLHAVDAKTGRERWKFKTNGFIDSSPLIIDGTLFFGGFDTYFYAVDAKTGRERWKFKTGGRIISSPSFQDAIIYFGSDDGSLYALHSTGGKLLWSIQTNGPIETTPSISENILVAANQNNTLYGINLKTKSVEWEKHFKTGAYTTATIQENKIFVGSSNGKLYALEKNTGTEIWNYSADSSIEGGVAVTQSAAVFTTRDGAIHILNTKTGKSFTSPENTLFASNPEQKTKYSLFPITTRVNENSDSVKQYDVYELTVNHNETFSAYPWRDATISAVFTAKNNKQSFATPGFYYDTNTWKVRFAPSYVDIWTWKLTLRSTSYPDIHKSGSFTSTPPTDPQSGFIQINPYNQNLLTIDSKILFHPTGIQTCLTDYGDNGFPLDSLFVDGKETTLDAYLQTHGKSGSQFNIYRFGVSNCSFPLWRFGADNAGRAFLRKEGIWLDTAYSKLKQNGFHIWMSMLNNNSIEKSAYQTTSFSAFREYIRYIVARYGAYVDVWELTNEDHLPSDWIIYASDYLRSIDPQKHLITTSWERPDVQTIDINAPHKYDTSPLSAVDTNLSAYVKNNDWGKPLIFGEFGNQGSNWDPQSTTRMRVQLWVSFFLQTGIIYWDTSATKEYKNPENANIYIGGEERSTVQSFQQFIRGMHPNVRVASTSSYTYGVRTYALQTPSETIGYLYHYYNQTGQISAIIQIPIQGYKNPRITWTNPADGSIMTTENLSGGSTTITSPPFFIDIAYKISEAN